MTDYGEAVHPTHIPFTCVTCESKEKFKAMNGDCKNGLIYYRCTTCNHQHVTVDLDPE